MDAFLFSTGPRDLRGIFFRSSNFRDKFMPKWVPVNNKKAYFNYEILDSYQAGIMLNGPEVKAVRAHAFSFNDAYCVIDGSSVVLKKFHIAVKDGTENDFLRDRKLLLNKKEIKKLERGIKEQGLTIVPVSLYFTETNLIKVGVALARGKKNYDKRYKEKYSIVKKEIENNSI